MSQTKETRIPRSRCHGWVLKSWVKTYSGVFLFQCLLLMQNIVLRNMYTRKGTSHLRGIRSPAIPPPTCPCCPVGGASSHSGQEFNNIKMSILRCHQQGRRFVVGLLHQLGFFVWPVSLQELQKTGLPRCCRIQQQNIVTSGTSKISLAARSLIQKRYVFCFDKYVMKSWHAWLL